MSHLKPLSRFNLHVHDGMICKNRSCLTIAPILIKSTSYYAKKHFVLLRRKCFSLGENPTLTVCLHWLDHRKKPYYTSNIFLISEDFCPRKLYLFIHKTKFLPMKTYCINLWNRIVGSGISEFPHEIDSAPMRQILLQWNRFLSHKTDSAPMKQIPPQRSRSIL